MNLKKVNPPVISRETPQVVQATDYLAGLPDGEYDNSHTDQQRFYEAQREYKDDICIGGKE